MDKVVDIDYAMDAYFDKFGYEPLLYPIGRAPLFGNDNEATAALMQAIESGIPIKEPDDVYTDIIL